MAIRNSRYCKTRRLELLAREIPFDWRACGVLVNEETQERRTRPLVRADGDELFPDAYEFAEFNQLEPGRYRVDVLPATGGLSSLRPSSVSPSSEGEVLNEGKARSGLISRFKNAVFHRLDSWDRGSKATRRQRRLLWAA